MEYTYLTGRKELFDGAPERAMCVLEHVDDDRLFYSTAHELGAVYWNADGSLGLKTGLIALYKKTRLVALRRQVGVDPRKPQPNVPSAGKLARMQEAERVARTAMNKPRVADKALEMARPEMQNKILDQQARKHISEIAKAPHDTDADALLDAKKDVAIAKLEHAAEGGANFSFTEAQWEAEARREAVSDLRSVEQPAAGGFVSIFALAERGRPKTGVVRIQRNGTISISSAIGAAGDFLAIEVNETEKLFRIGKDKPGARKLTRHRQINCAAIVKLFDIPADASSLAIEVTQDGEWWMGKVELLP